MSAQQELYGVRRHCLHLVVALESVWLDVPKHLAAKRCATLNKYLHIFLYVKLSS
jgi:hypothetical protein